MAGWSASKIDEALQFAREIGYLGIGKVVFQKVIHRSEKNGVEVDVDSERKLRETFSDLVIDLKNDMESI